MKKIILSLALIASASVAASAQEGARFGVKAGANLTTLSGDNPFDVGYKFGGVGGLALNYGFSESLSLQTELLYSMKGAELKGQGVLAGNDFNLKMNYLDLPIMFRYSLNEGQGVFLQAGPQLGYYLNGKISDGDGNEEDIDDGSVQKLELGYVAAVGYQTEMGLSIEARFNGGINSIAKDDEFYDQSRNRVISLQLGYMFGGK